MTPKTSSAKFQTLKQGTLPFATSKRTKSSNNITKTSKTSQEKKLITSRKRRISTSSIEESSLDDVELISEEEEGKAEPEEQTKVHRSILRPRTSSQKGRLNKSIISELQYEDSQEDSQTEKADRPELSDKDPRWRKHYSVVRERMGHQHPIHAEGQNKIHEILRVFDLSYQYGPCIGVTRLERWQRANMLGLKPPQEVHEILLTRQGSEQTEFSQSVFYDEV